MAVTWQQAVARRLERHALATPAPGGAAAAAPVTAAMCGVHAQVASAAELSLALRIDGATRTLVTEALWTDRTLVKTRGPRGTVHLLAAVDLPMWTGALSLIPRPPYETARDGLVTPEQAEQILAAIADALRADDLTTDELTDAIVARVGSWAGDRVMDAFQDKWPRWVMLSGAAMRRGVMCFGPQRGRAVTYTSPARWLPGFAPLPGPAAVTTLVNHYLYAYGPATPEHFAKWLSVPKTWAAEQFAAAGLTKVSLEGAPAWVAAGDTTFPEKRATGVRLLPYFDAYAVGSHPRELLFPGAAYDRALARGQAGNYPVLLVDGVVAGVWHQKRAGRRLQVTVEPLIDLSATRRRRLDEQVERMGEILEGVPTLTIGTVTSGPHA
ncbi:MAG: winged helix DNA-binding domain-containing protein [Hamadaea sp.]|nr:winged helix DNA-binding domain-containing protein [Hamadaea sp.]